MRRQVLLEDLLEVIKAGDRFITVNITKRRETKNVSFEVEVLISPAFKMLGWGAVSGSQRLFLCMLQNPNVKVFLSVDFVQESLRFVFQHLLDLAGETWQETQSGDMALPAHTGWENTSMIFLLQSSLLHAEGFCMSK